MGTTVALSHDQLAECIMWLLENPGAQGKAYKIKGKAYAALMCMIFLTGGRIGEVLDLKIQQIADGNLHLYPNLQMRNSKRKTKKEIISVDDAGIGEKIKRMLVESGVVDKSSEVLVKAQVTPVNPKQKNSIRTVSIDNNSELAQVVEDWLRLDREEQGHINPGGYVFTLGVGSGAVRISYDATYKAFRRAYKGLELNRFPRACHGIRKSSSMAQYEAHKDAHGGDGSMALREVKRFLGHRKLSSTEVYVAIPETNEREIAITHAAKIKLGRV